jgi:hypothetical protein
MEAVTMTGTGKATVETLQRLLAAFNAHDLDAVMSFFVDDPVLENATWSGSVGSEVPGAGSGALGAGRPIRRPP